jgi:serine/threonine-protein kinase
MATAAADLNLLFAVLALQNELVGRDALLAAMTAWGLAKHRRLADILVERGALPAEDRQLVDGLIERQLKRHGSAEASLTALPLSSSVKDQIKTVGHPDLEASLAHLSAQENAGNTVAYTPTPGGLRYRILRPHARGGLGEVFVAEDMELHREIALKQMQVRHAGHDASRGRFVLEAEITGSLEHPGIVPVYGLGSHADGRPYYAMRFIRGDNLKEAIAQFHRVGNASFASLEFRQLLGRFIDVCNAVAYAHSRGVLHRDLKPGNIMLGKFGETLVVDWGLAKVVGQAESRQRPGDVTEETPLTPHASSGIDATVAGSAIGTPAYMSPEQAAGRIAELGPATDVYSLGATLYTLLTNRAPAEGTDHVAILHQVQRGEVGFARPESAAPASIRGTPTPLVAVCRKAMALKPQDRYASPLGLAEDLEHWLADDPVTAYAEPWTVRAGRWVRRHRLAVTAAVAAVGVALVCVSVAAVLLNAARDSEHQAKLLAEENERKAGEQRDKSRAHFLLARSAVDKYHTQVSESPELKAHGLEKLRTKLLETASQFYEQFVKEDEADVTVQAERGSAYLRLGIIYQDTGSYQQADTAFLKGLAIWQQLADEHPDEPKAVGNVGEFHHRLGWLYQHIDRWDEAEKHLLRSVSLLEPFSERDAYCELTLGWVLNDLGILYQHANQLGRASEAHTRALALREKLVRTEPDNDGLREALEASHTNLANVYAASGDSARAEKHYDKTLELAQQLAARDPSSPSHQSNLRRAHYNLGFFYSHARQPKKAEQAYRSALQLAEKLAGEHPAVVEYQTQLAGTQNMLACLYKDTDRWADADALFKNALAIREKLFKSYPLATEFAVELGGVCCNRGDLLVQLKDYPAATASLQSAKKVLEAVLAREDRNIAARRYLLRVHNEFGNLYRARGQKSEAEEAFRLIALTQERLARDHPDSSEDAVWAGGAYCNYGHRLFENQKNEPAVEAYTQAIEALEALLHKDPKHGRGREFLVNSLFGRGRVLSKGLHRHPDALQDLDRALTLANEGSRDWLRGVRSVVLARSGEYRQAAGEALAASEKESASIYRLADAALTHALAAAVALRDGGLAAAEREPLADRYAAQAVKLFARAAAKGHYRTAADIGQLKTDPELALLRSREDFTKLLADLEKKAALGQK